MLRTPIYRMDNKKLRLWLSVFFLALAIPTGVLVYQAYSQLKWEAFHQHQVLAEELAARIDNKLIALINDEEARSFSDYAFLNVVGDPSANFIQRSPLSSYPVSSSIPGLIGYFQVDTQGAFSTPLLPQAGTAPEEFGISGQELNKRLGLQNRIQLILSQNRLVQARLKNAAGGKPKASAARQRADVSQVQQPSIHAEANAPMFSKQGSSIDRSIDKDSLREGMADGMVDDSAASPAAEEVIAQSAFDRLNEASGKREYKKKQKTLSKLGRVEDLKLDYRYQAKLVDKVQRNVMSLKDHLAKKKVAKKSVAKKQARKERSVLPESRALRLEEQESDEAPVKSELNISIFESELDPLEFSLLDSGHFVVFRKVWRNGQRFIQGMLLEQAPFLEGVVQTTFRETALSQMSDLIVAYQGEVFSVFTGQSSTKYLSSTEALGGAVLHQARLSTPLSDLELIFSINRLPTGPGGKIVTWVAIIITLVLIGGFYLMYRLGIRQIELGRQQQDFVSAVSHELKTPLTSIRMYGEMLREGWATDEKKQTYYDYIYDESERLSRLINNVLQLARMTRNEVQVELKPISVSELMDGIRSKVSSQIERTGFELNINCEGDNLQATIQADSDSFSQIIINLVDNALKFSEKAEKKMIDIGCERLSDGKVQFTVRDYGPGVNRDQMKKIFKLFYRPANELTRDTVGTGIGLALVHQLTQTMKGSVDVINKKPGAEFRVTFPVV